MSPVCDVYHPGEAVEVRLVIRNLGNEEVQIAFGYPHHTGVHFSCQDSDAVPPSGLRMAGRVPTLRLKGGEQHTQIIALNRHLTLMKAKRYTIDFIAEYVEPVSNDNPRPRTFSSTGRFAVVVENGSIDMSRVQKHIENVAAGEIATVEEAAEMLLWTDHAAVIEPLVRAAKRLPSSAPDIVRSLAKHFRNDDGRMGILEVARNGNGDALRAALRGYEDHGHAIPTESCESILSFGDTGKLHPILEYVLEHGGAEYVRLVRTLERHHNPEIRKLASRFVAKMAD